MRVAKQSSSSRLSSNTRNRNVPGIRHLRIWITNAREVTRACFHVQIFEKAVIPILRLNLGDARFRIGDVTENYRLGRACLSAGGRERIAWDQSLVGRARANMRRDLRFLDALH